MANKQKTCGKLAVCIRNDGYPAALELRKLYRIIPDPEAAKHRQLRVVDESGENYLYPKSYFLLLRLPGAVERVVMELA